MSTTSNTVSTICRQNKPKSATASKRLAKNSTSARTTPPRYGNLARPHSVNGSKVSANPEASTSKQSKKSSAKPGSELVEVSTEFANSLRACVAFFEYRGTIGGFLEREADWIFDNLLNDTSSGGEVREFLSSFRLRGKRHAQRVADRFNARSAAAEKASRCEVIREGTGWELDFFSLNYLHWQILSRWCRLHGHDFEPYRVLALENGSEHAPARIMAITSEGAGK
jgi:hypothetical protein